MWQEPKFDENQFDGRRTKAVGATKTADDWETTGISFQDFGGMHIHRRKARGPRRLKTPNWALNDEQTRAVVLRSAEDRLYIRDHTGTDQERLDRITCASKAQLPEKKRQLERLMIEHHRLTVEQASKEILDSLAVQIQVKDTEILMLDRGVVAMSTAVVYAYYRRGLTSVEVAEQLGIKPPMIRVWNYRLNTAANRLGIGEGNRMRNPIHNHSGDPGKRSVVRAWPKQKVMAFFAMRTAGTPMRRCAQVLGEQQHVCEAAWRHYFGSLQAPLRHVSVPRSAGLTKCRERMANRLRTLFILRTSGKTWEECARALQYSGPPSTAVVSVIQLWKRHFGRLNIRELGKQRPPKVSKPRCIVWTPDKIAQLKTLREIDKLSFGKIAKLMGRPRPQDAQGAYARYILGKK